MTRRSTRLMRLENSLYVYNPNKESWQVKEITRENNTGLIDIFEQGSYFTCKHMSQKVNPTSFRLNIKRTWNSTWYSDYKSFGTNFEKLQIDLSIREYIESIFNSLHILVDKVYIKEMDGKFFVRAFIFEEGVSNQRDVLIHPTKSSRYKSTSTDSKEDTLEYNPFYKTKKRDSKYWYIDGKKVATHIQDQLTKQYKKPVYISLFYRENIGNSASLLGKYICKELEKPNTNFKKVLRDSLQRIKDKQAIRGLRINCSGRLSRAPMAKMEWFRYGSIPLTKISAEIDYIQLAGRTRYGTFGLKVWLYKH